MSPLFSQQPKPDVLLTLDIGSARISAAIVELNPGIAPDVLFSINRGIAVGEEMSLKDLSHAIAHTLEVVLTEVAVEGMDVLLRNGYPQTKLDTVAVTISAPWVHAQTQTITHEPGTPFSVSPKMLDALVEQEIENIVKQKDSTRASFMKNEDMVEVVDRHIMHLLLNGYESHPEYSGEVETLEADLFVSVAPRKILNTIRQKVDTILGVSDVFFNAFSVIVSAVLRDMVSVDESFVALTVGGEMSEAVVIHKGVLQDNFQFEFGRNHMIRNVARAMNLSSKQAHSLLRLYAEGAADAKANTAIKQALADAVDTSNTMITEKIASCPESHSLPLQVFIIADEEVVAWMNMFMGIVKPKEVVFGTHTFHIALLGENTFAPFCHFQNGVYRSPFLATEALFFNKMHMLQSPMDK